jgi:hypothetical protein
MLADVTREKKMKTENIVPNAWYRFTHESATAKTYLIRAQWISATGKKNTPNYTAGHQEKSGTGEGVWKTYNGETLAIHNRHIEKLENWRDAESVDALLISAYGDAVKLVRENEQKLAGEFVRGAFDKVTS